ncbi:MAG: hypothetical protein OWQ56_01170 [Acidithiobacillus caldus]|nr:hypothetical protein [Acidithiobacillus caldus]
MIEHRAIAAPRPPLPQPERSLLLCSGGVESFTLTHAFGTDSGLYLFFLDYGQRAAAEEWKRVQTLARSLRLERERFDLRDFGEAVGRLRPQRYHVPTPHRNLWRWRRRPTLPRASGAIPSSLVPPPTTDGRIAMPTVPSCRHWLPP